MPHLEVTTQYDKTQDHELQDLLGQVRRFGHEGILYEVIRVLDQHHLEISVLNTGEKLSYPISEVMKDPSH